MEATRTKLLGVLLACLLCVAVSACALGEAAVTDAVKQGCIAAGGKLMDSPRAVRVVSPYGTQSVVLRDAPSDSYDAVAMLMVGQEITAVGMHGEFYFVLLENGTTGWLAGDEAKLAL